MRILDETGAELIAPDYALGYTTEEVIVTARHEATEAVAEQWHYEVVREYPNGGKDVAKVIDVPGVKACPAWEETETILRYHPYTAEELAAKEAERAAKEAEEQEAARAAEETERENARLRAQVAALVENQQFLEDCIAEMAELVYA